MYDNFTLLHALAQNGTAKSAQATTGHKIQTITPGGHWGPYLMTVVYFLEGANKLKASYKL